MRRRRRAVGSTSVTVGLLPGAAAIVLFWALPFLLFGLISIAALVGAINDAEAARRAALAAPITGTPAVAWPSSGDQRQGSARAGVPPPGRGVRCLRQTRSQRSSAAAVPTTVRRAWRSTNGWASSG